MNRHFCFQDIPILKGLNSEFFKLICQNSFKKKLKRGEYLFHQGDQADSIYIIKKGSLKSVYLTNDGEELLFDIITAGNVIGENSLFNDSAVHVYTLIALEETLICSINRNRFRTLIDQNNELAYNMIKNISEKYHNLLISKGKFTIETAEQKLINLFFSLAEKYGVSQKNGCLIKIQLTQEEIASLIGVSRVTVSKELRKLKEKKLIVKKNKYYIIYDIC